MISFAALRETFGSADYVDGYTLFDVGGNKYRIAAVIHYDKQRMYIDYGEIRYITLGMLNGVVVIIATTETEKTIHVISMRKADKNEQKIYFENR